MINRPPEDSNVGATGCRVPRGTAARMRLGLRLLASSGLLAIGLAAPSAGLADLAPAPIDGPLAHASGAPVSAEARQVADWVVRSGDNRLMPFMIVDKANARMFVFASDGALLGDAPVLLGLARGDDSPPGIGDRPLAEITPAERITPAGRFEASLGRNLTGRDILWVDYAAAISVHRATDVKPGMATADRLARLASPTAADNRISHGCINVSSAVFEGMIRPAFAGTRGVVYVLPETRSIHAEFPAAA